MLPSISPLFKVESSQKSIKSGIWKRGRNETRYILVDLKIGWLCFLWKDLGVMAKEQLIILDNWRQLPFRRNLGLGSK